MKKEILRKFIIIFFLVLLIYLMYIMFLKKNYYNVVFDLNNGEDNIILEVLKGTKISNIPYPEKQGYEFLEWQLNGITYSFETKVTSDITLVAKYKENYLSEKPTVPTVKYISGSNEHKWQNNIEIELTSTHPDGISYYEVDMDNDGEADKKLTEGSQVFVPSNNDNSCNVRFRAVSVGAIASEWTSTYHIHMDTEKPSKTIVSTGSYIKSTWTTSSVTRTFSATDNVGIHYYEFSNSSCSSKLGNEGTYIDSEGIERPVTTSTLSGRQINLTCHRAVDYAGNKGEWSDVTVVKIANSMSNNFEKKGVKALFFGDSITYGVGADNYSWANYIGDHYNIGIVNMGASGWCVAPSSKWCKSHVISDIIPATSKYKEDVDYVILHGGVNDVANSSKMDNNFIEGFENYLSKVTKKWPNARIGYIINYKTIYHSAANEEKARVYYNKMKEILSKYNISYIDLFDGSINGVSFDVILNTSNPSVYISDDLHLNKSGHFKIAPYIYNWMKTIPVYSTKKGEIV